VSNSISYHLHHYFNSENDYKYYVSNLKGKTVIRRIIVIVHAHENDVTNNDERNKVFEVIMLNNFEEKESEPVMSGFYVFNFQIDMDHYALHFYPLFLFFRKTMRTLSLPDFFVEFVNDN